MTGFGKGEAERDGTSVTVEIRAVNHRYCDINLKAPRFFLSMENRIRQKVSDRLKRGKIDLFISMESMTDTGVIPTLNRPLAQSYIDLFKEAQEAFSVNGDIPLSLLMTQKDVVVVKEAERDEEAVFAVFEESLNKAIDTLEAMRTAEGRSTFEDIERRLATSETLLTSINSRSPSVAVEWKQKLEERLKKYLTDMADPQRVAQEVAIFADRCDISEEIARFGSHLEQFRTLLVSEEPVGRQLDFLVQELNRETNTMGSKSNDAELTRMVVSLKAELEKIREQVQNIE